MVRSLPEQTKGSTGRLASSFCIAADYLSEPKVGGGLTVGSLLILAGLITALLFLWFFDSPLIFYLLFIGVIAGNVAHIQICKREGLKQHLFWEMLRIAGIVIGVWFSRTIFENSLLLGVTAIAIGAYAGDFVRALISKWHREA